MRYSQSSDVEYVSLGNESVLLNLESGEYYKLNDTAAAVWACIAEEVDVNTIVRHLRDKFDPADVGEMEADCQELLADFVHAGVAVARSLRN